MEQKKKALPTSCVYIAFVIAIVLFFATALYFGSKRVDANVVASIKAQVDSDVDYRVYYTENPFYSEPYLKSGLTYIASYIDHIDVDFMYENYYNDTLDGSYDYYVKATVNVSSPIDSSQKVIWSRDYKIGDIESVSFKNDDDYQIKKTISLNYQEYLNDYLAYKEGTALTTSAVLDLNFYVLNYGSYDGLDDFKYQEVTTLEIPLSDPTFNISVLKLTPKEVVNEKKEEAKEEKVFNKIIAILLSGLGAIALVSLICYHNIRISKLTYYEKRLHKILHVYDPIIVNVEKLPSLAKKSVIEVTTFDELLDAQNEITLPINFYEDKKKRVAKFVLIKSDLAWVYTLKEDIDE